jgi:hypothetical protein
MSLKFPTLCVRLPNPGRRRWVDGVMGLGGLGDRLGRRGGAAIREVGLASEYREIFFFRRDGEWPRPDVDGNGDTPLISNDR